MDAFAEDFCPPGDWCERRPSLPPSLSKLDEMNRIGPEVVHLSYDRLKVSDSSKPWNCGEILDDLFAHTTTVGSASVATGATYGVAVRSASVAFPSLDIGS